MLSSFEYVFGLSRYLNEKYDYLHFDNTSADDEINPMGFELVNACINSSNDKIKTLYLDILKLDINLFESRLIEAIEFVGKAISKVTSFKGNSRSKKIILHSKYQIMSMISTTFKEKYDISDLSKSKPTWKINRDYLEKNMIQHYIHDIIRDEWSNGGTSKIHSVAKPNKYLTPIPKKVWESTLNSYFDQTNMRREIKNVANPRKEDIVILNCIYLSLFSALDQLSLDKFDIEHIATKDKMKTLIAICQSDGLPVSSIANLCYLPEKVNRSKGPNTFYQDDNYKKYIDLKTIEDKYSFTKEEDLEWIKLPYTAEDSEVLKEYYMSFLNKRFVIQKEMFYSSLNIVDSDSELEYDEDEYLTNLETIDSINLNRYKTNNLNNDFREECVKVISRNLNNVLKRQTNNLYISEDKSIGVTVLISKKYIQGSRDKFWFAYRNSYSNNMKDCKSKFIAFACETTKCILLMPIEILERNKHRLRYTEKNGRIHWHIVFYKDNVIKWHLSLPEITEVDISNYLIQ